MEAYKPLIYYLLFLTIPFGLRANGLTTEPQNDSLVLAQAYINLSLTETYFETLSSERISKILPFEENELASIVDRSFIAENSKLYNFTYALLYFNKAKFLFRKKGNVGRKALVQWKNTLEQAIKHFDLADGNDYYEGYSNNEFYDLINFNRDSRDTLHHAMFRLKRKFGPYFNEDIYPDFKRIFNSVKTKGTYHIDSLSYYAKLYDLEFNTSILYHEYDTNNYNYGPKTLSPSSEYRHTQRYYGYYSHYRLAENPYLLDPKLDLISRFLQLKYMASKRYDQSLDWFELYLLYNAYYVFVQDLDYYIFNEDFKLQRDTFFEVEINQKVRLRLYEKLRKKFPYDSFVLAQSYINLSIMDSNFPESSSKQIEKILATEERTLSTVKDAKCIRENPVLYNFTYALLYSNSAKKLYRDKREIDRNILIQWKNSLEKGIRTFNRSQQAEPPKVQWERDAFYELIKLTAYAQTDLQSDIQDLKGDFTPFFNADVYPDFKCIFYEAKNTGSYNFEALLSHAAIYNLSLNLSILNRGKNTTEQVKSSLIAYEYRLDKKLDLISRYLQLKYLATSNETSLPEELGLKELYEEFDALKWEVLDYRDEIFEDLKDPFFEIEMNAKVFDLLLQQLQEKYPYPHLDTAYMLDSLSQSVNSDVDSATQVLLEEESSYFFPNPAPLASANLSIPNYKPELSTLGDVDNHMSGILKTAGYEEHMHYYYHELNGFALTTSLEKFNLNGSPVENDRRWVTNLGGDGKFSYYEIFKSLFFEIASEFRMFAFIVSSKRIEISSVALSAGFAEELLENSHPELPEDLKNRALVPKDLTVLVYHFHQNDIGQVPELELNGNLSALEHLSMAGLENLVNN